MAASAPPQVVEYGADEISALVLDPGYSVTRAGFAGEDHPKSVIPSFYGVLKDSAGESKRVFDDNAINNPFSPVEIFNPMSSDGIVEDWDVAKELWEYSITSRLTVPPQRPEIREGNDGEANGHQNGDGDVDMKDAEEVEKPLAENPLLMTEPPWNPVKNREKSMEIAMEEWGAPAFYLARSPVLAAFASGKSSALVVDIGASTASVTPVHDGLILKKGIKKSPLAGNFLSDQLRLMLEQSHPNMALRPHYQVKAKTPVDAGAPANFVERTFESHTPSNSFHRYQQERILNEFKESIVQVWNPQSNAGQSLTQSSDFLKAQSGIERPFEMPDGSNDVFGIERFKAIEGLFDPPSALVEAGASPPKKEHGIPELIKASLAAVDVDVRPHLLNNVVVTGGATLVQGFNDRLLHEIQAQWPGANKIRVNAPGNVYERKFGGWIGGSILASLGTFHQSMMNMEPAWWKGGANEAVYAVLDVPTQKSYPGEFLDKANIRDENSLDENTVSQ